MSRKRTRADFQETNKNKKETEDEKRKKREQDKLHCFELNYRKTIYDELLKMYVHFFVIYLSLLIYF